MKMDDYHKRKLERTEHFLKFMYKNKLIVCGACSGSGKYDTCIRGRIPKCGMCNGTGKVREKDVL